jgi:FAD/FMN-containing dehydrogenase
MSPLQPVAFEWVGDPNEVWIRFGEHPKAVDWQLKNMPPADWIVMEAAEEAAAWEKLRERYQQLGPILVRVIGLPSATREIIEEYQPSGWIAHALNGIVLMAVTDPEVVHRVRTKYRAVIERASIDVRRQVATFGLTDTECELMRRLKQSFDSEGRLNPGRHVDGECTQAHE